MTKQIISAEHAVFLAGLKDRIRAALNVNRELVSLYWEIGRGILARQASEGWGTKVIERLAQDLRREFPDMRGLSSTNLKYMKMFAAAWPEGVIGQQLVDQLPWGHNIILFTRLTEPSTREWYARQTIEHGWSRAILEAQIETKAHARQGKAITNFDRTLPASQSELALLKRQSGACTPTPILPTCGANQHGGNSFETSNNHLARSHAGDSISVVGPGNLQVRAEIFLVSVLDTNSCGRGCHR